MSDYMNQEENQAGQIQAWFSGAVILQAQLAGGSRLISCGTDPQTLAVWGFLSSHLGLGRNGVTCRTTLLPCRWEHSWTSIVMITLSLLPLSLLY